MKKVIAFILALMLTGSLALFCVSLIGVQVIGPAMNEDGAPVSSAVLAEEKELVRKRVTELADLYGFTAERVVSFITDETLQDLNEQASQWWASMLSDGKPGEEVFWNTDGLVSLLAEDPKLTADDNWEAAENLAVSAAEEIRRGVVRIVLPLRQPVIRLGMQEVKKRVDLPNIVSFFLGLPWAVLALSALLAGLIALLESRRIRRCLVWIGSAAGAAALVLAGTLALVWNAGLGPMIREASESLAVQFSDIMNGVLLRAGLLIAVLLAGCAACLALSRRNGKKA